MGTSSSYRSPQTPRWRVFTRALDAGLPLERLSAQLFLAGEPDWRPAFETPGLATFAEALIDAHATLSERFAKAESPVPVVGAVVTQARRALFEEDYSQALPVAERALRTVLIATAQGELPLADASGPQAAQSWDRNRGEPQELVHRFVSELFGQWAEHVASRDTPRLLDLEGQRSTASARALSADLARHVAGLVGEVPVQELASGDVGANWPQIVERVFEAGRRLDPLDGA